MQKDPLNRVWLYGNWWTLLGVNQCTPQLIGFGARLTRNPSLQISNVNGERRSILCRGSDIRVFTEYGTLSISIDAKLIFWTDGPLHLKLPGGRLESDKKADRIFSILQSWIMVCNNSYKCAPLNYMLPTCIIDLKVVQSTGKVYPLKTHRMRGRYVALSHCWDPPISHPFKTTPVTLRSHKGGIQFSRLPQTFRDVIAITIRLKISYL
jgi:hypothetical protein